MDRTLKLPIIALLIITQYFLNLFNEIIFLCIYKLRARIIEIQFDIFNAFVENSVNSELRALLFLSSSPTSQNLKFIRKCPCLSSLKNKFQWTQNFFWPLIRKILILTFWDYRTSWSKKSTPIQSRGPGCNRSPPYYIFSEDAILGSTYYVHFFRGPWLMQLFLAR